MAKKQWVNALAQRYVSWRLRRNFQDVRILDADRLREVSTREPCILALNHVCWWDPLVLVQLGRVMKLDGYALMDRANMAQFPFFGYLGALPISRDKAHQTQRDLVAATQVLAEPRQVLALFPHGAQRPAHLPLEFKRGVFKLARMSGVKVVPIALRYDFHEGPRALVTMAVGHPQSATNDSSHADFLGRLETEVRGGLVQIDEALENQSSVESLLYAQPQHLLAERASAGAQALRRLSGGGFS